MSTLFDKIEKSMPEYQTRFTDLKLDLAEILEIAFPYIEYSDEKLANLLKYPISKVTGLRTGFYDITIREIAELECKLGIKLIEITKI